jgi:exopolysaccharide biosynthesis WecB/TagA/CpsF family protein
MTWAGGAQSADAVAVTVPSQSALLDDLRRRINAGLGFTVATLNLDHVVKLHGDPDFYAAYARHSHVTADGNPVVWLCRLAGQRDVSLVPGSELIDPVAALAAETGLPVGLFGATPTSLQQAADALVAKHPGLKVAYCEAPPMGFDPEGEVAADAIEKIRQSGARVVFLALGAPKQERFAARAAEHLPGVGFLSIGAGLDFVSGAQVRAPLWVRGLAAEWIWRLASNPSRLAARYGKCLLALPGLTLRALRIRRRKAA